MSETDETQEEHDARVDREHPEKAAAEGREGERGKHAGDGKHAQDETDNENIDTGEHSDAPGPFGTG
jgi:hypothetical protein